MTPHQKTLNDAFALANTRYDLLCADYRSASANSAGFFAETFIQTTYKKSVLDSLTLLRRIFRQNYSDFAGRPLIDEADLTLYLDDDIATPNAWSLPTKTGGLEITTTLGLLVILDVLCAARWVHITELFPDQPLPDPPFETVCSKALAAILQKNLRNGLSDTAKLRLAEFFSNPTEQMRQDWTKLTTLTTLWVLSHEVGHYLCGHIGHNEHETGIIGLSERPSGDAPETSRKFSPDEAATTWARELMADAYATIRLSLIVCEEVKEKRWPGSISDVVDSITTASILPGVAFLLGREVQVKQRSSIFDDLYPSEWSRIFGVLASFVFVVLPLPNTAIVDPRKNPLEQFWQDQLFSRTDWQMFLVRMIEIFETIKNYLNDMNLIPLTSGWDNVSQHVCGSLFGSRTGVVALLEESPIRVHLLQWMYAMKLLCTQINFNFSHYLARNWLTGTGEQEISENLIREDVKELLGHNTMKAVTDLMSMNLTNDPAYKILDDWMSNIYSAWESGEQEILKRQEECSEVGRTIVHIWQNI